MHRRTYISSVSMGNQYTTSTLFSFQDYDDVPTKYVSLQLYVKRHCY